MTITCFDRCLKIISQNFIWHRSGLLKLLINCVPDKKLRKKLRQKYFPKTADVLNIRPGTKCLMVCPHPDDEMLGAGGVMIKYAGHFDCICLASAGVKTPTIEAEPRADLRIQEFHRVMDFIGIKNRWIFKTFGVPPMIAQIEKYYSDYCKTIDTTEYDYIFLPHPLDNHPEHIFITQNLFKRIMRAKGFKNTAKVVFYEVWTPIHNANWYEDISEVAGQKFDAIRLYASQNGWINYPDRVEGLNKYRGMLFDNVRYAEAFLIGSVRKYLRGRYE